MIDGLPVLGDEAGGEPVDVERPPASSRALAIRFAAPVQAVAAAVGGFFAGIAVVGLLSRRNGRRRRTALGRGAPKNGSGPVLALARRAPKGSGRKERRSNRVAGELVQVVASRSLLVDVHLLGSRGQDPRR